jgi:hypothetical protein
MSGARIYHPSVKQSKTGDAIRRENFSDFFKGDGRDLDERGLLIR